MTLAQKTPNLLLDEAITFVDLAHQIEVMELIGKLVRESGKTVIGVVHDLNQAAHHRPHGYVQCWQGFSGRSPRAGNDGREHPLGFQCARQHRQQSGQGDTHVHPRSTVNYPRESRSNQMRYPIR